MFKIFQKLWADRSGSLIGPFMALMASAPSLWQKSGAICRFTWLFLSENATCRKKDAHIHGAGSCSLTRAESVARATS